jgi:hypothetical protein
MSEKKPIYLDVLVDGIKDFFYEGFALPNPLAVAKIPYICEQLRFGHDNKRMRISLEDAHENDYAQTVEGKNLPIPHGIVGTLGAELVSEFQPIFRDAIIIPVSEDISYLLNFFEANIKEGAIGPSSSVRIQKDTFGSRGFIALLNSLMVSQYEVVGVRFLGVLTGMCDISNIVIAKTMFPNAEIMVDAKGCADLTDELHEAALASIERLHITVLR